MIPPDSMRRWPSAGPNRWPCASSISMRHGGRPRPCCRRRRTSATRLQRPSGRQCARATPRALRRSRMKWRASSRPCPRSRPTSTNWPSGSRKTSPRFPTFPPRTCPKARTRAVMSRWRAGGARASSDTSRRSTPISVRRSAWTSSTGAAMSGSRASPSCVPEPWRGCTGRSGSSCSISRRGSAASPNACHPRCWCATRRCSGRGNCRSSRTI